MSVGGVGSSSSISAIYQAWLKQQQQQTGSEEAQSEEAATATSDSASSQQTDVKSLLARLTASQPSLLDYLSGDGSGSSGDNSGDSASSDASDDLSKLKSVLSDIVNFDPNQAALDAFKTADSDTYSSNPYDSLMSSYRGSAKDLSSLLDKLYSQTDVNAPSSNDGTGGTGTNSGSSSGSGQTGDTQQ